jgi:putative heme-binding domain-containing protein
VSRPLCLALTLLAGLFASPAHAQRDLKNIPDPDPELERKSFLVAEGFEVNLFAADPLIAKPIQMNFDPAGRLWIVSSEVYPQIQPGQTANDKVLILEDTDGDGHSDKTKVFADGLLIPTGIEPGDGGAYVANSTELLHFKDTDGDGKADRRRVVLSGFGTEDTHHILHTLRWGYDGMLYFNQSVYIHSHIETPYGVRRLGGGGIWQFRTETMRLEVFLRGLVNPWGHHFDRWGQGFATDGAGGEGINYILPGASYFWAVDAVRVLPGLNPGSPKYCGLEVVSGRHLPESWQGNLVTNDFRANRVCRFVVTDDGAGFAAREQPEIIKTTHPAFRPIDVKMGPDGAIYVADWYNPIIQHGEVDFRDPRRDHTRGRIWRITAKGRPLVERPKLLSAGPEVLLEALKAPEDWTRQQAKRVLKERGPAVVPALAAWVKGLDASDPDHEHRKLEALWTYQSLDIVEPNLLADRLVSKDARVRAAATRVVQHWADRLSDPAGLLARMVLDEDPRVRLEAVRVLAHVPDPSAPAIAMRVLDRPVDKFLEYALWLTARETAPNWLPSLEAGRFDFEGHPGHLVFALNAVNTPAVVKPLLSALRAGKIAADQQGRVLGVIATLGGPDELGVAFDAALADDPSGQARQIVLLGALTRAAQSRKVRPSGDLTRIGALLEGREDAVRAAAARTAGAWGLELLRPKLAALAGDPQADESVRRAAIEGLGALGGPVSRQTLEGLSGRSHSAGARRAAVAALVALDVRAAAKAAVAVLAEAKPEEELAPLFLSFLERKDGPPALAEALIGVRLPADVAKVGVRLAAGAGGKEPALVEALRKSGDLSARPAPPTGAARDKLLADVRTQGDAARGEMVFRRKDMACFQCHAIAGAGGQVGPSLESIGASAPLDYLLDSLLEPDKAVKENYHSTVVATKDGRLLTGIKIRQTDRELTLRDAEDREVPVPLSEVEEQKTGGSLMPAGQTDPLTRAELLDLVRFLSELGKVGPYSVGKAMVARRWQVLEPTQAAFQRLSRAGFLAAGQGEPSLSWAPAYSKVLGLLPPDSVPATAKREPLGRFGFVRCQVEVTSPGDVTLVHNQPSTLALWIDGQPATADPQTRLTFAPGTHTLTFALPLDHLGVGLRLELQDVPGSPAKARFAVGK